MPTNKRAPENDARPSPKSRPLALQVVLVGIGIALVPLAGVGILWLKKFTAKPSDSEADAESIIKKYSHLIEQYGEDPP